MKIAQITRQFAPAIGGLEEAVLKQSLALKERHGLDVEIITLDRIFSDRETPLPAEDMVHGLPVTRLPFSGSRRYPFTPAIFKAVAKYDVLHVHAVDFFFDALAWGWPLHRKPMVATTHGGFFHSDFASRAKKVYFQTVTRVSSRAYRRIFATSENDARLFRGVAGDRITLVENGVDTAKWADLAAQGRGRTLIYFGRLSSNKRVEAIFPVLAELAREEPGWRLIVAGRADDVSFEGLADQARAAGISEAVEFVPSPSNAELAALIGRANYYVSASAHEGFGISVVEAMSAGLVPVLSRIPPFERFVPAAPGILFDPARPAETAQALRMLDRRPDAQWAADRQALIAAASGFDWGRIADIVADYYRRIMPAASRS